MIDTAYLDRALDPRRRKHCIRNAILAANELRLLFKVDSIVITGWSGALIGIPVADALGLPLTIIRQVGSSHSRMEIEGYVNCNSNCLVIDDICCTGKTLNFIQSTLVTSYNMQVSSILLYDAVETEFQFSNFEPYSYKRWRQMLLIGIERLRKRNTKGYKLGDSLKGK